MNRLTLNNFCQARDFAALLRCVMSPHHGNKKTIAGCSCRDSEAPVFVSLNKIPGLGEYPYYSNLLQVHKTAPIPICGHERT